MRGNTSFGSGRLYNVLSHTNTIHYARPQCGGDPYRMTYGWRATRVCPLYYT